MNPKTDFLPFILCAVLGIQIILGIIAVGVWRIVEMYRGIVLWSKIKAALDEMPEEKRKALGL